MLFLKLPDSFFTKCAKSLKGNRKPFSDIVCLVPPDRSDRSVRFEIPTAGNEKMTILTMPRCPGAGRGGAGGAAVLLLDVLHPQDTLRVQGGVLRSAMAKHIFERFIQEMCGSDIVLLFLIPDIITFQAATRTRV